MKTRAISPSFPGSVWECDCPRDSVAPVVPAITIQHSRPQKTTRRAEPQSGADRCVPTPGVGTRRNEPVWLPGTPFPHLLFALRHRRSLFSKPEIRLRRPFFPIGLLCNALLLIAFLLFTAAQPAKAQSQNEMNQQAAAGYEKADAELNRVYKKLMAGLDKEAQAKLKAAQRAWIAFRDAQAEFDADDEARGGSMYPLIYYTALERFTRERIKQLKSSDQ